PRKLEAAAHEREPALRRVERLQEQLGDGRRIVAPLGEQQGAVELAEVVDELALEVLDQVLARVLAHLLCRAGHGLVPLPESLRTRVRVGEQPYGVGRALGLDESVEDLVADQVRDEVLLVLEKRSVRVAPLLVPGEDARALAEVVAEGFPLL